MWKLIDANIRSSRYMLNALLLFGLLYAMVANLPVQIDFP